MEAALSQKNLAVYVQDHLAGAAAALQLLDRVERLVDDEDAVRRVEALRRAVDEDRRTLDDLRSRLGVPRSRFRETGARLLQKLAALALRLDAPRRDLQLLHALDSLAAGVQGKRALWSALAAGAQIDPRLRLTDYDDLLHRADDQLATLRRLSDEAARHALTPD